MVLPGRMNFESVPVTGPGLIGEVVFVPVLCMGSGFEGCPMEFVIAPAGFFPLAGEVTALVAGETGTACRSSFGAAAEGAAEFVVVVDDVLPVFGGTTCTMRCGVTAPGGVATPTAAGLVEEYGLDTAVRGVGELPTLSGTALNLS